MLSLIIGEKDVIGLCSTIKWSGSYSQCARTLIATIAASPYDKSIPTFDAAPGTAVKFLLDDTLLFSGFVIKRARATSSNTVTVTSYDKGFYLNRNQIVRQYKNTTPEAVAADLCGEFGIETGDLASTGYTFSRNFIGVSVYKAIMTGYTLASGENGKKYQARLNGDKFEVIEIKKNENTLVIKGKSNLQDASYTDSIEKTVTEVVIYDKNAKKLDTVKQDDLPGDYGTIRQILQAADGKEKEARDKAKETLADTGLDQQAVVQCLGNVQNISGNTVIVQEEYTGLCGLFWISADTHEWKNGVYYNKLTLSFRELMDKQEAGSAPNADGKKTSSKSTKSTKKKKASADSTSSKKVSMSTYKYDQMGG